MLEMIHTYPVCHGGRHVLLVTIPGEPVETYVVVDIPVDAESPRDVHMVGNGYATKGAAWSAATRHVVRSIDLGRPAIRPLTRAA